MNKKLILLGSAVLAAMLLAIGIGVAVLYSGVENTEDVSVKDASDFLLLPAVPSDAILVGCFSNADKSLGRILSGNGFAEKLSSAASEAGLRLGQMSVSLHYSGKIQPLYIFDTGDAETEPDEKVRTIMEVAASMGWAAEFTDCSTYNLDRKISQHSIVLVSPTENLIKSSQRHLQKDISVIDAPGFADASTYAAGDVVFISGVYSDKLLSASSTGFGKYAGFVSRVADWIVLNADNLSDDSCDFSGKIVSELGQSGFIDALKAAGTDDSELAEMLPSYTFSAMSLPLKNFEAYVEAYGKYLDYAQMLQSTISERSTLKKAAGISPIDFYLKSGVEEAAVVSFVKGGRLVKANLIKVSDPLIETLFAGTGITTLKDYTPQAHPYRLAGFAAAAFGRLFRLEDESCFTYINGWIISGSREAVDDYASGLALSYNLKEYMANADLPNLLASPSEFIMYLSFTEDEQSLSSIFRKGVVSSISELSAGADYSGAVFSVGADKVADGISARIFRQAIKRSKAPAAVRETKVEVPAGPFKVKNSGTGKTNLFSQQTNNFLSLKEESGKGIWTVNFSKPLCGRVHNIDIYANGKIQFLFGAGSEIYVIDRLGRFVKNFPVNIGKEILLGPDVYDFNGTHKYNIMVLHKDNTIDMYNLKGQKPASWKGISPAETIVDLPERLILSGNTFWVVRTAVQTLIYPFAGGEPLSRLAGDQMALPTTQVRVLDGSSVEVDCYDGKKRTLKIK